MAENTPAWVPDWKDESVYTDRIKSRGQIAWEFLRRNLDYQADFAHFQNVPEFWQGGGKTPKFTASTFDDDAPMLYYAATPPGDPDETLVQYESRMKAEGIVDYTVTNLEDGLCEKWGIESPGSLPDPADDGVILCPYEPTFPVIDDPRHVHMIDGDPACPVTITPADDSYLVDLLVPPAQVMASIAPLDGWMDTGAADRLVPIWFSLDANIKDQLDKARDYLVAAKRQTPAAADPLGILDVAATDAARKYNSAPELSSLIKMLRVFDARQGGISHSEIQRVIACDTNDCLAAAKTFVKKKYRQLIGLS